MNATIKACSIAVRPSWSAPASALAAGRAAFCVSAAQLFPRGPLNPIRRAARRFLDACSGALHRRDKRSGRRSRWRARAGGARATAYGVGERKGERAKVMHAKVMHAMEWRLSFSST